MKLVIGGYAQGKLNYILQEINADHYVVFDGSIPDEIQLKKAMEQGKNIIINHLHSWVRECIAKGGNPEEEILSFLQKNPEAIIISDEIGNGIVPMDPFEREYRERTGRILVSLASLADEVVRVLCGIGQKIK
ncbi:MAG: hypothetical protein PWP07_1381 [Epulopiscium sp.]|uniref:Uncharacterized protein n=1 Tax=Defluviitalea raffinosedens TaxID=1450156 RepID=A0A7C8LCT8_9FIRM|nr:bifunctional adenosylcobinamide kinase/adenosylcobinamide-phosphate guanylyltransferase [Defluviitalea raffinosedens]MBZ4667464.1 Adenosyl cobinamide kinase/adenosyl cobinamide phosphate guanylyltransferase [Defluviitaleaceae bacterium]MDK2788156.1 hypothetical protein [Candidatus Epulonipiscium sp.]KAE9634917.1 hypothetical protein GND95_06290 [Defluviitalea raffinosedens]MBM7685707.1 adenosyl cobinamide kinase/adenosyl cobinamide phosphate guanylyltransferase [Defluviitalea raffinosedens]